MQQIAKIAIEMDSRIKCHYNKVGVFILCIKANAD
jgi:hypothetical protein